ncbi:cupin domain-containing protein [Wenzhouxiangella sp. EGI_FJ10305]|uniref:cupin domain-containing protein n=1 Tax=Wenzhouxiangella sp. EGI_FJ10305 TaxID=3243768 RepID=UPI0035DBC6B8
MTIRRARDRSEYWFEEGCWITELSNQLDDPDLSVARARVAPGDTTRWHALEGITERYVILAGQGRVELDREGPEPVTVGDVVIIEPGRAQRIENDGDQDLVFLALCTPRFRPECYRDLE